MSITRYSGSDVALRCAGVITKRLAAAIRERGSALLGVPGGRSVSAVFAALATASLAWDRVDLFPVDERCVPTDDPESNYRLIYDGLVSPLLRHGRGGVPRLHAYNDMPQQRDAALRHFNARFHAASPRRHFDVLLLGVGEDGHIASLFPNHALLESSSRDYALLSDAPKPPPERITVAPAHVREAASVLLLLLGEGKRAALEALMNPEITYAQCPARLALEASESKLFTDIE